MKPRVGLAVPAAYFLLLLGGAVLADLYPAQPPGRFWNSAQAVSLLERSFLRCLRARLDGPGLTVGEEALILMHQRDAWVSGPADPAVATAPLERVGRQLYIKCAWFLPPVG